MNVAEHTVPSFCCGIGAASSVVADSLGEADCFFGYGRVNVVRFVTSCTALSGERWSSDL